MSRRSSPCPVEMSFNCRTALVSVTLTVTEPLVTTAWDWNFPSSVVGVVDGAVVDGAELDGAGGSVGVLPASEAGSE